MSPVFFIAITVLYLAVSSLSVVLWGRLKKFEKKLKKFERKNH